MPLNRQQIAMRAAQELCDGYYANLGIGIPTMVANYIPQGMEVIFHSENGILAYGAFPYEGEEDADLINAGKQTVSELPGTSYFDSSLSFGMIRGGHVDLTILGAMQVDARGSIANYMIPGKLVKGPGGGMDLVAGVKRVVVAMEHVAKNGEKKILENCNLPLTGVGVVTRIITDYAVIDVTRDGLVLVEKAADLTVEDIQRATEARLIISPLLRDISV